MSLDVLLCRARRRVRDALPGASQASRLAARSATWRQAPPAQQAAAYAQYVQTRAQLQQFHYEQKITPKLIRLLFRAFVWWLGTVPGALGLLAIIIYVLHLLV
jgi:hypothetical protein